MPDPGRRRFLGLVGAGLVGTLPLARATEFAAEREAMVAEIQADVRFTRRQLGFDTLSEAVLGALRRVPRHAFVPADQRARAYANRPLPIGHGQTISQPYIVAAMTELLRPEARHVAFELGTGSGYQAAVLGEICARVHSMEIIEALGLRARATLERLRYDNVVTRVGDGYHGWPEHAPFDRIVVTAAGDHIPPPLVRQLRPGGRMVMPVGSAFFTQQLVLVEKDAEGGVHTRQILPVRFVPLTGGH